MPLPAWPTVSGLRTVEGGAGCEVGVFDAAWGDVASCEWLEDCRRRRALAARFELYYYWATWPPSVGRWADIGGALGPRGVHAAGDVAGYGWPEG